jgi:hypothetical protein
MLFFILTIVLIIALIGSIPKCPTAEDGDIILVVVWAWFL